MAQHQMMTGTDGTDVKCFKRNVRNVQPGDYLPTFGATVLTEALLDGDRYYVALDNGAAAEFTLRAKVWLHRVYRAPAWVQQAVAEWRSAYDAREALRESEMPAPTSVPGIAGSQVAYYQLEPEQFALAAGPAPRLADFLKEHAAARREDVAA